MIYHVQGNSNKIKGLLLINDNGDQEWCDDIFKVPKEKNK